MKLLDYEVLEESGYGGFLLKAAPVKVLQFGEGAFLRAFADCFFDMANERADFAGKIAMVQPRSQNPEGSDRVNAQEGLYTLYLRGMKDGKKVDERRVISAVDCCLNAHRDWESIREHLRSPALQYVVSNTTEAGIVYDPSCGPDDAPPVTFPAKLTLLLHDRFAAELPGLAVLPCELIDDNGRILREYVLRHAEEWYPEDGFADWIRRECVFCNTLVDRIVPGKVTDAAALAAMEQENGYRDELAVVGEVFGVWYIEALREVSPAESGEPAAETCTAERTGAHSASEAACSLELLRKVFRKAEVHVRFVPDAAPYKKRKVRILNGAHTGFVPGAYLAGFDIVRDCMHSSVIRDFMNRMLEEEIIPVLPLPEEECREFAAAVQDRFDNPFVDHALLSITLNSTSKWRTRNLPSLLEYKARFDRLPPRLVMSLAMLIAFYSTGIRRREKDALICCRDMGGREQEYRVLDDAGVLDFYCARRDAEDAVLVREVLENRGMWGQDLTQVRGLESLVAEDLALIRTKGAFAAFEAAAKGAGDNGQRKV